MIESATKAAITDGEIERLLGEFLTARDSTSTGSHYRGALSTFAKFCGKADRVKALHHLLSLGQVEANTLVRDFRSHLEGLGRTGTWLHLSFSPVRAFVNYVNRKGTIDWRVSFSANGKPRQILALPLKAPAPAPSIPQPPARHRSRLNEAAQLVQLLGAHNRNTNTRKTYERSLQHFAAFTGKKGLGDALAELLRGPRGKANKLAMEYLKSMQDARLSSSTVAVRISALRAYVRLAYDVDFVDWKLSIRPPRIERNLDVRGPDVDRVRTSLQVLSTRDDSSSRRDCALVWMLASMGLRASELLGIDLADLDLEHSRARILGKGRTKPEPVTIPPEALHAVKGWLRIRGKDPGPLFTGLRDGTRLRRESLWKICRQHGLGHTHGMRHFGVTSALDLTNGDLRRVAKFSRHRNLNTLVLYDDLRGDAAGDVARLVAADLNELGSEVQSAEAVHQVTS